MENLLKFIAKQANLDRVLFTPALKKIYFDMAVASGGATQFKHADSARKGLSFIADKAGDNKHALLFCACYELIQTYDLLLQLAQQKVPAVVLALRSGVPDETAENWNYLQFNGAGWLHFHTHTLQEAYDHLALAYYLYEEKKLTLPALVLHSRLQHDSLGDFTPREELNLGNPLTGLQSARASKKMSFEDAVASMKKKKEKTTLADLYQDLPQMLREGYEALGYALPAQGLPFRGQGKEEAAVISLVPENEEGEEGFYRLLCYRPFAAESLLGELAAKKIVAAVEPKPSPGTTVPPFFAEISGALSSRFSRKIISVTVPSGMAVLAKNAVGEIKKIVQQALENPEQALVFHELS
ncbi:MAG: hypothetical protein AB1656_26715 [Candidatus Omnitrophota bacterium]